MNVPPGNDNETHLSVAVEPSDTGQRLDAFLARAFDGLSRSRLKALVKAGHVTVDGRRIEEPNYRITAGEAIHALLPAPEEPEPQPEDIPLNVVFEDDHVIVVDKPAGLVVHPGAGNWTGTLVNALIHHCGDSLSGIGGVKRPGIVHRIDKDTSGLLVVAKTDRAHRSLSEQFADHGRTGVLERAYTALCWGVPQPRQGTIETLIERSSRNRLRMAVVSSGGRHAITHYRVTGAGPPHADVAALVECRLETGRTHQIRVHLAHIGHPLVGDREYGQGFQTKANLLPVGAQKTIRKLGRQALHAHLLVFAHPDSGDVMRFESGIAPDFKDVLDAIGLEPIHGDV